MKLIYFLPIFSFLWMEVSSTIDITPIHSSPGLYYEQVGEVSLSNNNWEFVTYVNYSGYLLFYKYLHVQAEKLQKFCQVTQQELCTQKYDALKLSLNAIDEEDETMANYLGIKKPRRRKRFWGILAGIAGSLLGSVFGGGSRSPDMSKYDQAIGSLQQGQAEIMNQVQMQATMFTIDAERKNMQLEWLNRTQEEIKGQMGVLAKEFLKDSAEKAQQIKDLNEMLDETNNKLKKHAETQKQLVEDVTKIKDKLVSVDKQLTELNNKIDENKASINQTNLNLMIVSIAADFHLLLSRFEREQNKLFNAIVKAKKAKEGELDPYVLSPLNLIEMLQGIIPNLKENEKFPFYPNVENAHLLYNLIQPDVFLSNDALIFVLKLPLIHFKKFNLFKMTTVPVHVTNQLFTFVLPQEPYLLIDKELEQEYMLLPLNDFRTTCSQIKKINYICKQTQFLRQVQGSNDCEIKLFTSTTLPKTCDTRLMKLNSVMFIQLQKWNSWLYAAPEKTKDVTINCGPTERNIVSLIGTGFMNIKEDCNVRVENNPLVSLMEYTKPVISNYTSAVNLLDFIILPKTENLKLSPKNPKETLLPFEFESLKEVSIAIDTIEEENYLLYWLIAIPIAFLAALIFLAYKMNKNHQRIKGYFSKRSARNAAKKDSSIQDRLRMKVKMRDNNEKIKRVSMKEEPSEDPDAEYLTVRFKVEKNLMNNAVSSMSKVREPSPTVVTKNFDNLLVDKCSKNLIATKERNVDNSDVDLEKGINKNDDYITMKRPLPVVPGDENDEEASEIVYGNVSGEKGDDSNDEDSEYGNVIGPKSEDAYLNELRKLKLAKLRAMKPKGGLK